MKTFRQTLVYFFFLLFSTTSVDANAERKFYDAFLFFNEIELLKIRLEELYDVVDFFVIVESNKTFSGIPKPSYYLENKEIFNKYSDKIIHIFYSDFYSENIWENEFYQRNQIVRGLKEADNKDLVLMSDVDEIPRKEIILKLRQIYRGEEGWEPTDKSVFQLELNYYVYNLNLQVSHQWRSSCLTTVGEAKRLTPQKVRATGGEANSYVIKNAGWHFSWICSPEDCLYKLKSFSHAKDHWVKNDNQMLDYFRNKDFSFAGSTAQLNWVPIDNGFPQSIRENIDYYTSIKFISLCEK